MEPRIRADQLAILKAVTDESRDGVIVFDAEGRVLHQNAAAAALLPDAAGRVRDQLKKVCVSAITLEQRQHLQLNGWALTASPLAPGVTGERIGILTIWPRVHSPTCAELRRRFAFTAREAEVAALLIERRTDAEIAEALGISWHTVRSHIERIFAVLRCHSRRQAAERLRSS